MADTVNVDTLAETVRKTLIRSFDVRGNGVLHPNDRAILDALADLAARARLSDQRRREVLDLKPAATALVKDRDRIARRVAELEQRRDAWVHEAVTNKDRARAADRRVAELEASLREARAIALNGDDHRIPDTLGRLDAIESVAANALAGDGGGA